MSDNPQVRIEVAEAGKPERCANCNYFAQARGSTLQLFNMGWCARCGKLTTRAHVMQLKTPRRRSYYRCYACGVDRIVSNFFGLLRRMGGSL